MVSSSATDFAMGVVVWYCVGSGNKGAVSVVVVAAGRIAVFIVWPGVVVWVLIHGHVRLTIGPEVRWEGWVDVWLKACGEGA